MALHPPQQIVLYTLLPIGDSLFALPTIQALRERYPDARITALASQTSGALLRCAPPIDGVVVMPTPSAWVKDGVPVHLLGQLREQRFEVAIDFTTPAYKWISFVCGVPRRTYMKFDRLWWIIPGTHQQWRSTHAARHYYDCAQELDLPPWEAVGHVPQLELPKQAWEVARSFLQRHGVREGQRPLIGIHASGAWLGGLKRWPMERFAALADRLAEQWGARVLLLGQANETALVETITARMHNSAPILATGAMTLPESVALIALCDLFIGNDSGLLHAAAAMGTPFVGIFGPTNPDNFAPLARAPQQGTLALPERPCRSPHYFVGGSPIWHRPCCSGTCRALSTVSVDAVFAEAEALLRKDARLPVVG